MKGGPAAAARQELPRQYDLWWASLPEPAGRRPVLLLTRDSAYPYLNKFVAVEITTVVRGIAQEVPLGPTDGLPRPCAANLDNIRTVAKSALTERIGRLSAVKRAEVKRALGFALGWDELVS